MNGRTMEQSGRVRRQIGPVPPPVRDAVRGARALAKLADEAFAPATTLFPGTFRSSFRTTAETLGSSGKRLVARKPSAENIRAASRFVAGFESGLRVIDNFVNVFGFGWDKCVVGEPFKRLLQFSETIASLKIAALAGELASCRSDELRAARILVAMREVNATGRVPGTPIMVKAEERFQANLAMFAIVLWLLADRPENHSEEDRLLELSHALVKAQGSKALFSDFNDVQAIRSELARLRPHL